MKERKTMSALLFHETRYFEDTNEIYSSRIWELVKAGSKTYDLRDYDGVRDPNIPMDQGASIIDVKVERQFRKTQKDDWVSMEEFLQLPDVAPFGKMRYSMRYNVKITVKTRDRYDDKWTVGTMKYWFTKKCSDTADSMIGGPLASYNHMATDLEVSMPKEIYENDEDFKIYYTNLVGCWIVLVDEHIKTQNEQKFKKLAAIFA